MFYGNGNENALLGFGLKNYLKTADILDLDSLLWIPGPSLNVYLHSAATAPLYYDSEKNFLEFSREF